MQPPDLESDAFFADPGPTLSRLSAEAPVLFHPPLGAWVLCAHADVSLALRDPRFSVDRNGLVGRSSHPDAALALDASNRALLGWMVFADPPLHTRLREAIAAPFARASVDQLRPSIERAARDLASSLPRDEPFDLVARFAVALPERVTADLLGLPRESLPSLQRWTDSVFALLGAPDASLETVQAAHDALTLLRELFAAVLDERTRRPGDDLVSRLLGAQSEAPTLTRDEVIGVCITLVVGSFGTTAHLISNAMLALCARPALLRAVAHDDDLAAGVVEETLRTDGPALSVVRRLCCDVALAGQRLRERDRVYLMLHAANHDPRVFERPLSFDPLRKPNRHLGLGAGPHVCLGAALTRLETRVAIAQLARSMPGLRVVEGGARRTGNLSMRGLSSLVVEAR